MLIQASHERCSDALSRSAAATRSPGPPGCPAGSADPRPAHAAERGAARTAAPAVPGSAAVPHCPASPAHYRGGCTRRRTWRIGSRSSAERLASGHAARKQPPSSRAPDPRLDPHYDRGWLRGDLIAGVTVAALIVPKNLGYAGIAGIPLQNGLYAAAAGAHPVRGLRHQPADLDGAELRAGRGGRQRGRRRRDHRRATTSPRSSRGSRWRPALLFLLLAVLRMGWIAQFLSRAVVTGFLFGAAIDVVIGELPKLTGTDVTGLEPVPGAVVLARHARRRPTGRPSSVGVVALVVVFGLRARRAARSRCARPRRRRAAGVVAVRPRRARRRAGRRRARAGCPRSQVPDPAAAAGPRRARSRSPRSRWC